MSERGVHDLGGLPGGPVDTHEHTPTLTERRIDAMMMLMRDHALFRTDENRRTIENMLPDMYESSGYYEKWVRSMRSLLIEKGVLTETEIETRLAQVRARASRDAAASPTAPVPAAAVPAAAPQSPAAQAKPARPKRAASSRGSKTRAGVTVKGEPERGPGGTP